MQCPGHYGCHSVLVTLILHRDESSVAFAHTFHANTIYIFTKETSAYNGGQNDKFYAYDNIMRRNSEPC